MGEGPCQISVRCCSGDDFVCMISIEGDDILIVGGPGADTVAGAEFLPDSTIYRSIETFEFKKGEQ